MSKLKTNTPRKTDCHSSTYLVRVPVWCRPALVALKAKNRRPTTTELLIALERHCESEGIPPPREPQKS